jgi:hypothetical protein
MLVLTAHLHDRGAQLRVGVEERAADAGFGGDRLETDRRPAPVEISKRFSDALFGGNRTSPSRAAQRAGA